MASTNNELSAPGLQQQQPQQLSPQLQNVPATATEPQLSAEQLAAEDLLRCRWHRCGERQTSAEALYTNVVKICSSSVWQEHICERHIGRKSTSNLNLVCGWGNCRTSTIKRDHITSHVRVHVPLKPHRCTVCEKTFKRPQDLKKHVKTHAEDIGARAAEANGGQRSQLEGNPPQPRDDLQALAQTASGYYENPMQSASGQNYNSSTAYYNHTPGPQYNSGVYYPVNHSGNSTQNASYDNRKRGYDAINTFLRDVKTRQIDATSYNDISQRLSGLQGIPIPSLSSGLGDYQPASAMVSVDGGASLASHNYSLPPMPSLRTKADLLNADSFLEQIQNTVYESTNHSAGAGINLPSSHYAQDGAHIRNGNSASHNRTINGHRNDDPHQVSVSSAGPSLLATQNPRSTHSGTPGLSPPTSSISYSSGHSPASQQSITAGRSNSSIYPTIGGSTADLSMGYSVSAAGAPSSILGTSFDDEQRRHIPGGRLQRAAQYEGDHSEANSPQLHSSPSALYSKRFTVDIAPNLIDPALSSINSPDSQDENDRSLEQDIENIRTIEALREYVTDRLNRREYEKELHDKDFGDRERKLPDRELTEEEKDANMLYPLLDAANRSA
ncbi:MAG: hypothetical protein M1829_001045 [Trizodia sp. TS-e1964]|nr:MAG: hypothetical protein M1829_001045 [Trizodia sp. TS-e1964]